MKYALIEEYVGQYSIKLMCRVLGVSRSGFYKWKGRPISERKEQKHRVEIAVLDTYSSYKARYGAPRIARELKAAGILCSVNHVAEIMADKGLKARNGKAFRYSRSGEAMSNVADNLLWRDFQAGRANAKWTSDITYIWVKDQWLYLATVMDLFSRKIVGWAVDTTMTEALITTALNMAFDLREVQPGLIIHSDRGVQYRAHKYQDLIRSQGGKISMSRKGNCWDNAPMESFFSRFKVELIYAEQYQSIDAAKSGIFEYIEIFYNRLRRHSAIGYVSPAEFERLCA